MVVATGFEPVTPTVSWEFLGFTSTNLSLLTSQMVSVLLPHLRDL